MKYEQDSSAPEQSPWDELGSPWNNIESTSQQTKLNGEPIQPVEGPRQEQENGKESHKIKLIEKFQEQPPEVQNSIMEKLKAAVAELRKQLVEVGTKALINASIPLSAAVVAAGGIAGGIAGAYMGKRAASQEYAVESHTLDQADKLDIVEEAPKEDNYDLGTQELAPIPETPKDADVSPVSAYISSTPNSTVKPPIPYPTETTQSFHSETTDTVEPASDFVVDPPTDDLDQIIVEEGRQ